MKRLFCLILLLLSVSALSARKWVFTVLNSASCPVTVNIGSETYVLSVADKYATEPPRAIVIYNDNNFQWSAYDKAGDPIKHWSEQNVFDDNGNLKHTRIVLCGAGYVFRQSDSSSSYDSGGDSSSVSGYAGSDSGEGYSDAGDTQYQASPDYSHMSTSDYAKLTAIETVGNTINQFGSVAAQMTKLPSSYYPYIGINLGMSRFAGQYARIKTCLGGGGGFTLMGGVGKEWIFSPNNDKNLLWHVGLGYYMTDDCGSEFGMNILLGETPVCPNKGLLLEISYGYFFGYDQIFGVYGSLGIGGGNLDSKNAKFIFDWNIGIAVKLWSR
ncbi:MAG: hypothetical protein J6K38_08480 [Alistipes sp.]|nr:hypothetical protein [Alistipes sp.]